MSWFSKHVLNPIGIGGGGGGDGGAYAAMAAAAQKQAEEAKRQTELLMAQIEANRVAAAAEAARQAEVARQAAIASENKNAQDRQNLSNAAAGDMLNKLNLSQKAIDANVVAVPASGISVSEISATPIASNIGSYGGISQPQIALSALVENNKNISPSQNANMFTLPVTSGLTFGGS